MGAVKEMLVTPHWEEDLRFKQEIERFAQMVHTIAKRLKDTPPAYHDHLIDHMLEWSADHLTFLELHR